MALTPAQRQRRSRRHRAGDHDLCDAARCPHAPQLRDVTPVTTDVTLPDLGKRGSHLWSNVHAEGAVPAGAAAALLEACRIADRLERLNAVLGDDCEDWMRIAAEARAQAVALKQLLSEVRQSRGRGPGQPAREVSVFDELRARREARRPAAGL